MEVKKTSLIEKLVAIIAPHHCFGCGIEDNVLCDGCLFSQISPLDSTCYLCGVPAFDWQPCSSHNSPLARVWLAAEYTGLVENSMHAFKFARVRAAYEPFVKMLVGCLPYTDWRVVPIPTAAKHVRQRGYDQTLLLAQATSNARGLRCSPALSRLHATRQVGASRAQRILQSENMFSISSNADVHGLNILLVDDVCTTGATLTAAATVLRAAGAASVSAVAVAWQPSKR